MHSSPAASSTATSSRRCAVGAAAGSRRAPRRARTSSTSFANPAVTLARTLSDTFAGIELASAPMFILMQLLGAAIAVGVLRCLFPVARDD